jgi:hypothetical protein
MRKNIYQAIIISLWWIPVYPVSIVYNLRIAETTKRQALEERHRNPFIMAATFFNQWRERYSGPHELITGGLATFIYSYCSLFARADFAVAHVSEKGQDLCFSRTQPDDILFSLGFSHKFRERTKITLSGLLGIPTHKDLSFDGIQFGTGHVGAGLQLDGSFAYSKNGHHSLMGAARFVRFFPRPVCFAVGELTQLFDLDIGTIADLLIVHHSNWGRHRVEVGYDAAWGFGAAIQPALVEVIEKASFMRNSFYGSYRYGFLICSIPSAVTFGLSYGFDQRPKQFGLKQIITLWGSWGISF